MTYAGWRRERYAVPSRNGVADQFVADLRGERDEALTALVGTLDERPSLALKGKIQFINELIELLEEGFTAPSPDDGQSGSL